MIDHNALRVALRARALALSVCTTGATMLSATATGFARAAGSFATDGFTVGMELTAAGFAVTNNNGPKVVTAVSALAVACDGCAVEPAILSSLAVGLPALRAYENTKFTPTTNRWFIEEDLAPGTATLRSLQSRGGLIEETGLYFLKLYGIANTGTLALERVAKALLLLFPAGDGFTLTDGTAIHIRGNPAPNRSQIMPASDGWAMISCGIPWHALLTNPP